MWCQGNAPADKHHLDVEWLGLLQSLIRASTFSFNFTANEANLAD